MDLIIDAAYIDFAPLELKEGMIQAIKKLPKESLCYFCFSFSKTLSFYGLRIGGLGVYGLDEKKVAQYGDFATMEARALWSVPNHMPKLIRIIFKSLMAKSASEASPNSALLRFLSAPFMTKSWFKRFRP